MRPTRSEIGELFRLAVPVVTVQVGMMMLGVVDTIMVGRVSPAHLAAVALGNLYFFGVSVFGQGVLFALDPVISQAVGAGDREGVARGLQRGVLLALALSLATGLLVLPVRPALALLRQPAEVIPLASIYAHAILPGLIPYYLYIVLRQVLQSLGRLKPIIATIVLANVAHVLINWVLIFGKLGAPALGVVGAGFSTSSCRWLMVALVLTMARRSLTPHLHPIRREIFHRAPLRRMIRLGAPIGAQIQLEFGAFAMIGICMGWLGTAAIAAHQVALNLASLVFMVPLGVAQAASVLVGRSVGRGDAAGARRAAGAGLAVGAAFMTLTATLFISVPRLLASVYSSEAAVVSIAAMLIPVAGIFQVFDGLQVVATSVLRGVGDTRVPMALHVAGFWLVGIPVSLLVGFGFGVGPVGLWWGLAVGLGVVSVLLLLRVLRRFSGELRRISIDEHLAVEAFSFGSEPALVEGPELAPEGIVG
jgi:MATE family multidrug resistance protein